MGDSYDAEEGVNVARRIIGVVGSDDLPVVADALTGLELSQEYTDGVEDQIGLRAIRHGADASLIRLSASSPATLRRRVRWAARFLARRGFVDEAKTVGGLVGFEA